MTHVLALLATLWPLVVLREVLDRRSSVFFHKPGSDPVNCGLEFSQIGAFWEEGSNF